MSTNYHIAWVESVTLCKPPSLAPALSSLDLGITYIKNITVHHDGILTYSTVTGILEWTGTIRILFNRADGEATGNTVAAATITLADNQFCYVVLDETDGTVLSMAKSTAVAKAASGFLTYNRLMLGYRNTGSDRFFSSWLAVNPNKSVQAV